MTLVVAAAAAFSGGSSLAQEGSAEAGQTKITTCVACHGADGNSMAMPPPQPWPALAGQHANYLVRQIEAFKSGERTDATMQPMVAGLSEQDMHDIAAWFSSQSMTPKGADPALVERGQRIYRGGIPERDVAACIACHGPSGQGNPLAGFPRVSHQHAAYLDKTLRDYRSGVRSTDAELNQMMRNTAELLLDEEIEALASYMQGLH
jgi:cytochrome c553